MKDRLFSWTTSLNFANKWDRMALTKKGAHIAAWVYLTETGEYDASIFNRLPGGEALINAKFKSLDEAKTFADKELKRQGYNN